MAILSDIRMALVFVWLIGNMCSISLSAQEIKTSRPALVNKQAARLVDQFGKTSSEDRSARFDGLFQDILRNPKSIGYIFLYCGKKCRYGEIEAHLRGMEIKIGLRGFDRSRLVISNAGFKESFETELWLVPDGDRPPSPRSTLNIRNVTFSKSTSRTFEAYECCDDYSEFWKNFEPG